MSQTFDLHDRDATLRLIDWFEIERVRKARVLVVGAGAIGNEVLKNLALIGIGHVFIIDRDTIEASNLSRSILFRDGDRGKSKAETAARAITEINPAVSAFWCAGEIADCLGEGFIRTVDVVIGCLDNLKARFVLNRVCRRAQIPWIEAGIGTLGGQVRVYGRDGACYECGFSKLHYKNLGLGLPCGQIAAEQIELGGIPTTPMIASLVAAVQVQECLKLLDPAMWSGRTLEGREFSYNGSAPFVGIIGLPARADCYAHDVEVSDEDILRVPGINSRSTAAELLRALAAESSVELDEVYLGVSPGPGAMGDAMVLDWRCSCGNVVEVWRRRNDLTATSISCLSCHTAGPEWEAQLTLINEIGLDSCRRLLDIPLSDLGIPSAGWVLARGPGGEARCIQLDGAEPGTRFSSLADLSVVLVTPWGQAYRDTKIRGECLPGEIIDDLVRAFSLPLFDVEYSLLWETQNRMLDNQGSLADHGVKDGDRIKLVSKEIETLNPPVQLNEADQTVGVTVQLPDLHTEAKETFDRDTSASELVRLLANKYPKLLRGIDDALPDTVYALHSMVGGRKLQPDETLRSARTPTGDTMVVVRIERCCCG